MRSNKTLRIQNLESRRLFAADAMQIQMVPNVGIGRYDFQPPEEVAPAVHDLSVTKYVDTSTTNLVRPLAEADVDAAFTQR